MLVAALVLATAHLVQADIVTFTSYTSPTCDGAHPSLTNYIQNFLCAPNADGTFSRYSCVESHAAVLTYYADAKCTDVLNTTSPSVLPNDCTGDSVYGYFTFRCNTAPDGLAFEVFPQYPVGGLVVNAFLDKSCSKNLAVSYGYTTDFCAPTSSPAAWKVLSCNATHYLESEFSDSSCSTLIDQHVETLACESSGGDGSGSHFGKCAAPPQQLNAPLPIRDDVPLRRGGAPLATGAGSLLHHTAPFAVARH